MLINNSINTLGMLESINIYEDSNKIIEKLLNHSQLGGPNEFQSLENNIYCRKIKASL